MYRLNLTVLCLLLSVLGLQAQALPELVSIPAGTFEMGEKLENPNDDRGPVRTISISAFSIAKTPITVAQYQHYCEQTSRKMPDPPKWGWVADHPMVNVTWAEAVEYADWLSDQTGHLHRLPTEAEWEYAAKEGKNAYKKRYSGSDSLGRVGWFAENSGGGTKPVAQKAANSLGLYDLSGNVWEWCRDWYSWYSTIDLNDPIGPYKGDFRIVRGGSWYNKAETCAITNRSKCRSNARIDYLSFRVVRPEQGAP